LTIDERIGPRRLCSGTYSDSRSTRAKSLFSRASQGSRRRDPLTIPANPLNSLQNLASLRKFKMSLRSRMKKRALTLITSSDEEQEEENKKLESSMSCEINADGLKFINHDV
jgi:hypothetical protein